MLETRLLKLLEDLSLAIKEPASAARTNRLNLEYAYNELEEILLEEGILK